MESNRNQKHPVRILICPGNRSEVVEFVKNSGLMAENAEIIWWCKGERAVQTLKKHLDSPVYIKSPHPNFAKLDETVLSQYPFKEWAKQVMEYDIKRLLKEGKKISVYDHENAIIQLCEVIYTYSLIRPDVVIVKAGTRLQEASFALIANFLKIPILYAERGPFARSLFLSDKTIGPDILRYDAPPTEHSSTIVDEYIAQYLKNTDSAWQQPQTHGLENLRKKLGIAKEEKILFYTGQVEHDANMLLYSPLFKTNNAFLEFVSNSLSNTKDVVLVAKPHPKEKTPLSIPASRGSCRVIIEREINIKEMFQLSSAIITLNSTTGFEALLYGKPVVTGANSFYSHHGFTFDVQSTGDSEKLRNFLCNPELTEGQKAKYETFKKELLSHHTFFIDNSAIFNGPETLPTLINSRIGQTYHVPMNLTLTAQFVMNSLTKKSSNAAHINVKRLLHVLLSHLHLPTKQG